jgi:hypothetical protein
MSSLIQLQAQRTELLEDAEFIEQNITYYKVRYPVATEANDDGLAFRLKVKHDHVEAVNTLHREIRAAKITSCLS